MTSAQARELFGAALDGELEGGERDAFERALAGRRRARAGVRGVRATLEHAAARAPSRRDPTPRSAAPDFARVQRRLRSAAAPASSAIVSRAPRRGLTQPLVLALIDGGAARSGLVRPRPVRGRDVHAPGTGSCGVRRPRHSRLRRGTGQARSRCAGRLPRSSCSLALQASGSATRIPAAREGLRGRRLHARAVLDHDGDGLCDSSEHDFGTDPTRRRQRR